MAFSEYEDAVNRAGSIMIVGIGLLSAGAAGLGGLAVGVAAFGGCLLLLGLVLIDRIP